MTKTAENTGAYLNELGPNKIHHFIGAANFCLRTSEAGGVEAAKLLLTIASTLTDPALTEAYKVKLVISTVKAFAGTLPLNLALRYPDVFGFIKTAQGR